MPKPAWFADHSSERFRFETQDSRIVFYYWSKRAPEDFQLLMQQALEVSKLPIVRLTPA